MMRYFFLNIDKLVVDLVPTFLRKTGILSLLFALTAPIKNIYREFIDHKNNTQYYLEHNSQVCYLRKVLNDHFDDEKRRILVLDKNTIETYLYIYTPNEQIVSYLYTKEENKPLYVYTHSEFFLYSDVDFVICIPSDVYKREVTVTKRGDSFFEIEAIVNRYKLVSKTYKIQQL